MEETKEPIKDEEMEKIVNKNTKENYHEQLKELIKNSNHGVKIAICSNISPSVSLDILITAYEENMGYELSKGNVVLDEIALGKVAEPLYDIISKEIGIPVSSLSDKQLNEIARMKISDDPAVFAQKIHQIYEEGHVDSKFNFQNRILQETLQKNGEQVENNLLYKISTVHSAKEINFYGEYMNQSGALSKESLSKIMENGDELDDSRMTGDLKEKLDTIKNDMLKKYNINDIELIRLCKELKYAERFDKERINEKIKTFLKDNPKQKELYTELTSSPDGRIPEKYIQLINSYEKDVATIAALSSVKKLLSTKKEEIPSNIRKDMVSYILAGARHGSINLNEDPQVIEALESLCPDVDFKGKNGKKNISSVFEDKNSFKKLKKYLPISSDAEIGTEDIDNLIKSIKLKTMKEFNEDLFKKLVKNGKDFNDSVFLKNTKIGIVRKMGEKIGDKITDDLVDSFFDEKTENLDVIMENMDKSSEEKYFNGSALNFTATDKQSIQTLYEATTEICWIDSKEDYLDLRCASLLEMKKELESKEKKSISDERRLKTTNDRLREFNKKYPNYDYSRIFDLNTKELKESAQKKLASYEDNKVKSKILTTFMKNKDSITNADDYNNLSDKEKEDYLKYTIIALGYKKDDDTRNRLIGKFAERRLEIINQDENKFIEINPKKNSGYISSVNYDKLLEEYNKHSKKKFNTFEELKEYCETTRKEYVEEKLDEYKLLKDQDFVVAEGKTRSERVKFIENMKFYINERENSSPTNLKDIEFENSNHERDFNSESKHNKENVEDKNSIKLEKINISAEELHTEENHGLPVPVKGNEGFFKRLVSKVKEVLFKSKQDNDSVISDKENPNSNREEKENSESDNWLQKKFTPNYSENVQTAQNAMHAPKGSTARDSAEEGR